MRLVSADSDTELAAFNETADAPKDLIPVLDRLTRKLCGKIGEPLKTIHSNPPLAQATTASLEALQLYSAGEESNDLGNFAAAVPRLRETVALETGVAIEYRKLGVAMVNAQMPNDRLDVAVAKAYANRERLTERERLIASAS